MINTSTNPSFTTATATAMVSSTITSTTIDSLDGAIQTAEGLDTATAIMSLATTVTSPDDAGGAAETQEGWESCSLGSATGNDDDDLDNDDNEDPLPIPGRESHTCDIDHYRLYVAKIKNQKRRPNLDLPFEEKFWDYMQGVLEKAKPVGYSEVENPTAVQHKGPEDNNAFMSKVGATNLINPIHPILVAEESKIPLNQVLTELLFAAKVGLVSMKLTPNCQRCGSAVCAVDSVRDIPTEAYCEGCRYKNSLECLTKIKVVFLLNRDVLYVLAENFACQPSRASMDANLVYAVVPATFTGSGFRYGLGCGGDKELRPPLPAGTYRMHCPVSRTDNYLQVERDATDEDEAIQFPLHVSDIVCRNPTDKRKTLVVKHGKIYLDVFTNTQSFFVLWIQKDLDDHCLLYLPESERKPYTNARELLSHATYQYLFAEETEEILTNALKRMTKVASKEQLRTKRKRLAHIA